MSLPLPLLVARVVADDPDAPVALDHLALLTDLLGAGSNLHAPAFERWADYL
jgi:hypothetical protein